MSAFNVVRFRVRPGQEQAFLTAHKNVGHEWPGLKHANIVKIGSRAIALSLSGIALKPSRTRDQT